MAPSVTEQQHLDRHPMDSSRVLMSLLTLVHSEAPRTDLDKIVPLHVLRSLLSALHYRDVETLKHSRRVALLSVGIATRLGWEEEELRVIEISSLLHDVGKIGMPDHILRKPGKLAVDESEFIAALHRVSIGLLQACQTHNDVVRTIAESHGIDHGGERNENSLGARVLAVADAYDSLTNHQSYRSAYDQSEAFNLLDKQAGKQFDRNVVAALGRWLQSPDSEILKDQQSAEQSIQANAPVDQETRANAWLLCQLLNYLYTLETLYEGYYFVDAESKILIWNSGMQRLTNQAAASMIGKKWNRNVVFGMTRTNVDPLDESLGSGRPVCHSMTYRDQDNEERKLEAQVFPVVREDSVVAGAVEVLCESRQSKQHRGQFRELQQAATRDALTGVLNRGELDDQLNATHKNWQETATPYSVVFFDLDHFKAINDRLTHHVGDRVLIEVARLVEDELYSGEFLGRYGGEEFVIVCPETNLESAIERAERVRRTIMGARFADRQDLRVTSSFGVTQAVADDTVEAIVKRADLALYDAKSNGRNRTCHRMPDQDQKEAREAKRGNKWVFEKDLRVCIASDLLHHKLSGYFLDSGAKIVTIEPEHMVVQVGSSGLFGGWGNTLQKQPVRITIDIEEVAAENGLSVNKQLLVKTLTEPIGKPGKSEVFQRRAHLAIEDLRSFLIAD